MDPPLDPRFRRIYNADEVASIEDYPFLAALLVNKQLWCGGAIIDGDTVITAAHCLQLQYNNRFFREYVKMLSVRVGSSNATYGGELYRVTEIFFHPNYKPNTLEFNLAILKLHKNITPDQPNTHVAQIDYSSDKNGFGGLGGQVLLQKIVLPVYDLADCQEIYGRDLVTRSNFCAGYITLTKNVCNHDAGGPAIMDGLLVGILSFSSKRCDERDQPAVFTTVGAVANWIETLGDKQIKLTKEVIKNPD
ncbi:trypsin 7 [Danaus plexippus plexippus]|uniref:Trypsin 7 n=1 Tax=Danaus plexippus plexippus TaxID=278856 RepID=A0A212F4V5_DANPL|nr:trypsin 7 [Danaus plexippus plexippus]